MSWSAIFAPHPRGSAAGAVIATNQRWPARASQAPTPAAESTFHITEFAPFFCDAVILPAENLFCIAKNAAYLIE
ncbi:hypothetical protein [Paraburkholderia sp.]|uniref:hypothetical protein n=1 Tax=Paraburkholderia sp. TaxID=1926495 RepID=UPI00286F67C4|nr:hypothetical protein [Paraburkholderia sp.]